MISLLVIFTFQLLQKIYFCIQIRAEKNSKIYICYLRKFDTNLFRLVHEDYRLKYFRVRLESNIWNIFELRGKNLIFIIHWILHIIVWFTSSLSKIYQTWRDESSNFNDSIYSYLHAWQLFLFSCFIRR